MESLKVFFFLESVYSLQETNKGQKAFDHSVTDQELPML